MTAIPAKIIANLILLAMCVQICCGSAIPIWEFLTRNEKMFHLYSTFAQLVSSHCKMNAASETLAIPVNQCKRNLLNYGNGKLQAFTDSELDKFDPYQRGANELIWSSIMRNHPDIHLPTTTTNKPIPTAPVTSLIILTQSQSSSSSSVNTANNEDNKDQSSSATSTPSSSYPINPIFNTDTERKHTYAMDMDIAYGYSLPSDSVQVETFLSPLSSEQTYLTGPLVIRVRPDGTPVEEDKHKPLPRDDDLEAFQFTKSNSFNDVGSKKQRHFTLQHLLLPSTQQQQQQQQQQQPQQQSSLLRSRRQFKVVNKSVGENFLLPPQSANFYYNRRQVSL